MRKSLSEQNVYEEDPLLGDYAFCIHCKVLCYGLNNHYHIQFLIHSLSTQKGLFYPNQPRHFRV